MKRTYLRLSLACSVLVPFIALSSVGLYEMDRTTRADIERTIAGTTDACMAAIEREVGRHAAVLQTLGWGMDGNLSHLRTHTQGVYALMRPMWMTVVLAQDDRQLFNTRLQPGEPLPPSRDPAANARVVASQQVEVAGVSVDRSRLAEPFISVRAPVRHSGGIATPYVLIAAVRAWVFTEVVKQCGVPNAEWRIGVVDRDGRIIGRTPSVEPNDPFIGQRAHDSYQQAWRESRRFFFADTVDGMRVYAGSSYSARYGWVVSMSAPAAVVEGAIRRVWIVTGTTAGAGLLIAALICVTALRWYGRAATTDRLEASLAEKEILLREIHHRVKNNLQSLWGMMKFERSRVKDPFARSRIEAIMERILILGSIHQQLYESSDLHQIDFAKHLTELVDRMRESLGPGRITFRLHVEPLHTDIETALPLGLIVSELISNALKHAFPADRAGTITVTLKRLEDDEVCLAVTDDGAGRDENSTPGIGMVLVGLLSQQIEARLDVTYPDGCHARLHAPGRLFNGVA